MPRKSTGLVHRCSDCPPGFEPITHWCRGCPDSFTEWTRSLSDHLIFDRRFDDWYKAIHSRLPGVERDPATGLPKCYVPSTGIRPFRTPAFTVFECPWDDDENQPSMAIEKTGVDSGQACAILDWPSTRLYHVTGRGNGADPGLRELIDDCRMSYFKYSPRKLWYYKSEFGLILAKKARVAEIERDDFDRHGFPFPSETCGGYSGCRSNNDGPYHPISGSAW